MVGLWGDEDDRRAVRVADYLAFPLIGLCGVLLIVDLNRPERFWHMLIQSQTYRPMFKWWSPMSAGSWALMAFSACSFASFLGVLAEDRRWGLGRWSALASRPAPRMGRPALRAGRGGLGLLRGGLHRDPALGDEPAGLGPDHLAGPVVPRLRPGRRASPR
jgi:hypothetical protein